MRWPGKSGGGGGLVEAHIRERSSTEGKRGGKEREEKKEPLTPGLEEQLVH